jgi:hypothetical protein
MKNAILVVLFLLVLAFLMNAAGNWLKAQPSPPDQKFEVVDRYNNRCDVIQYSPSNAARYTYFLDCKK